MADCPACTRAQANPQTGRYTSGCMPCEARMLATSPAAHSREADQGEAIQAAMRRVWPKTEDYSRGRVLVWGWIRRFEGTT